MADAWPKLSETLPFPGVGHCRRCNDDESLTYWVECDEHDQPMPVFVVLCKACADLLIEPHARLYIEQSPITPMPGVMAVCRDCPMRKCLTCTSPIAKFNGGPGLQYEPQGSMVHVCRSPRKKSGWLYSAPGPVEKCSGKEAAECRSAAREVGR